jgi:hypothetical protein
MQRPALLNKSEPYQNVKQNMTILLQKTEDVTSVPHPLTSLPKGAVVWRLFLLRHTRYAASSIIGLEVGYSVGVLRVFTPFIHERAGLRP